MRPSAIIVVAILMLAAGCESGNLNPDYGNHETEAWLVKSYNDIAIENAIIRQHTILPYTFIRNSDELNELGSRDLAILAAYYSKHPGRLNVRKGSVSLELYESRVRTILNQMSKVGVKTQKIDVADGLPGGEGLASHEVTFMMTHEYQSHSNADSSYGEFESSTGSN